MTTLVTADLKKEYEKNKEITPEDVNKLNEWLLQQPHLPKISELELIIFLNACYYSQELAKQCIDSFFTAKTHCPEFFDNKDASSEELKTVFDITLLTLLPGQSTEGFAIGYSKLMDYDADKFNILEQIRGTVMVCELVYMQVGTADGHVFVVDMDGVNMGHFFKIMSTNINIIRKILYIAQEAVPVRIKQVHVINTTSFADKLFALVKPFLKKSIVDVIQFHVKPDKKLYKHVPQKSLPNEYGGEAGSLAELHEKMKKNVYDNVEFFLEEEKMRRVDESKRPGKSKTASDLFGVEGSFKKLDID